MRQSVRDSESVLVSRVFHLTSVIACGKRTRLIVAILRKRIACRFGEIRTVVVHSEEGVGILYHQVPFHFRQCDCVVEVVQELLRRLFRVADGFGNVLGILERFLLVCLVKGVCMVSNDCD